MDNENSEDLFEALEDDPEYRQRADEGTSYEQFLDEGEYVLWITPELGEHIEAVLQKVPKRQIRKLIDKRILILAPSKNFNGRCLDLPGDEEDRLIIYLAPGLLNNPIDQIRHTIAH